MNYSTHESIRVVIADDHPIFLQLLESFLINDHEIKIVGKANDGQQLVDLVQSRKPNVVLTDIKMPIVNGIDATRSIKQLLPSVRVLALTLFTEDNLILQMLEAGADGYLPKSVPETEIVEAIKTAHHKGSYYSALIANRL